MTDKKWHQITTHIRVNCVHFVGLVFFWRWSQLRALWRRVALSTKWPQIRGDNTTHATLCSPSFSLWYFKKQIQKSHLLISFLISSKRSEPWLLLEFGAKILTARFSDLISFRFCTPNREYCQQKAKLCSSSTVEIL